MHLVNALRGHCLESRPPVPVESVSLHVMAVDVALQCSLCSAVSTVSRRRRRRDVSTLELNSQL